ncbi:MAG: hypothetical protein HQL75_11020 [Magnetococcales bacterium]|nr:hypothetical protein [Magnetococcales bacterium]
MNHRVRWVMLCLLMGVGWAETGRGETVVAPKGVPGLKSVVLKPEIQILDPVIAVDSRQKAIESALEGQFTKASWILDEPAVQNNGIVHVFDSETADVGKRVIIQAKETFRPGDRLTVHRPGEVLRDPEDGRILGRLSETLGIVEIVASHGEEATAVVVKAYKEILAGDWVDSFLNERTPIQFTMDPEFKANGPIVHVENDLQMAGLGQVVVVGLGMKDQVYPGLILPVYRASVSRALHEVGKKPRLDSIPLGEVAFFRIAANASLALITRADDVTETGDWIGAMVASPKYRENP